MAIGNRIYDWVEDRAVDWGERLLHWTGRVISWALTQFIEGLEVEAKDSAHEIIAKIRDHPKAEGVPRNLLTRIDTQPAPVHVVLLVLAGVFMIVPMVMGMAKPLANLFEYEQHRMADDARFMPMDAINAEYRMSTQTSIIESDLRDLGWTDKRINMFRELFRPLLDPETVRELCLRFPENSELYQSYLSKAGYSGDAITALHKLHDIVPPLPDMTRFADFGSFNPEIIAAWREFYDAPSWISEPFKLLGVTNEGTLDWANKYWFSHWVQPGRYELGEMHRRGLLGGRPAGSTRPETASERAAADEIVRKAYLTQGYSSFWQDRLLDLVGQNLTRVDVRRMHRIGVVTDAELSNAYHRLGYYGANNDHMVEFTKRYNATDDRDLTATEILKAYRRKTIDRDTAIELLGEIGYGPDEADFKLAAEDAGTSETERTLSEAKLKTLYLAGIMPKLEATGELQAKRYDGQEIAYLFTLWDLESEPAAKLPTRGELSHFLAEGILSAGEFSSWMDTIGYPLQHIDWYLEENTADQAAAARKEEEAALAEAERIEKATVKTDYMTARAALDVRIAEVKVFIADARRSLLDIGTDAERIALRELGQRLGRDLARLSLDARQGIAGLTLELRIAARGVSPEEKAVLERATLADRQRIESLTLAEREAVSAVSLAEAEAVRAEVSALRAALRENIASAEAQIARLKVQKAELKL